LPTLFWVHGGAFLAGDKGGLKPFALQLVPEGYTVISLNYALAPETHYPAAVVQVGEAYEYVRSHPAEFPTVDIDNLAFGGDSAGAQIASQFVALQTNPALAKEMQTQAVVPAGAIKATLLYCGPYQMDSFKNADSALARFFVQQVGWAYFGEKGWMEAEGANQVSTYHYVTAAYPPSFITDGNWGSFEGQGKALVQKLEGLGVPVDSLFYPAEAGQVPHEYQFNYENYADKAEECFAKTLAFLNTHMA
ncbi:MAG: alpha/beta hydrolase, partial [Oscillospiraceae bacterium]